MVASIPNLEVGVHTVISKYNVADFDLICDNLSLLVTKPENYITEIAENRVELGTMELSITPTPEQYRRAVQRLNKNRKHGIKQAFRRVYYRNVSQWLVKPQESQMPSCYAGYVSCQITPDGYVWPCCIKGRVMGNLRDNYYQLKRVLASEQAKSVRGEVKGCSCPMANVSYTNMLLNVGALARVVRNMP
jgi:MoaA/NifB/PqqE/SkfB family radical SAM enzyme